MNGGRVDIENLGLINNYALIEFGIYLLLVE